MSQLNFAMYCVSTAYGISSEHLLAEDDMIRNIYCFHVVFQTRKILNTLGLRSPYVKAFNLFKSKYDLEKYRKLCHDFDVNPLTDCRYKYDERRFIQGGKTGHYVIANSVMGWIQDQSRGLTQIDVQKLSKSGRTYVFLTLISQLSAQSSIIGKDGRALDAQSIWRTLFEQFVKSDSGINDEISRYQDVLQYASSKIDFNLGEGVYMLPSHMLLLMGNRRGFNNKILESEHGFKIGVNKLQRLRQRLRKRLINVINVSNFPIVFHVIPSVNCFSICFLNVSTSHLKEESLFTCSTLLYFSDVFTLWKVKKVNGLEKHLLLISSFPS